MYFQGKNTPRALGAILGEGWLVAFLAALLFHISVFALIYWSPGLFMPHRIIPVVYTVRLFEAPLPVKSSPRHHNMSTSRKHTRKGKKGIKGRALAKVTAQKRKISIPSPAKSHKKTAKKMVSLKPKRAAAKKILRRPPKAKPKGVSRDEERLLSNRLKKIREQVEEKRAESLLKQRLAALETKVKRGSKKAPERSGAIAPLSGNASLDKATKDYCALVWQRVRYHWNFPEELMKSKGLECIISVRIAQSGKILGASYEKRSGHGLLDETALRAILESNPLPPLPGQLRPGPIEIGIRFRPEER